jgi:hypothetical protein
MAFWPNTIARTVYLPQINLVRGLVLGATRRMEYLSSRRPALSLFRSFMKLSMCGEKTLPTCPPSPAQEVTLHILNHFRPFKDLEETFAVSRRAEQLCLRTKQAHRSYCRGLGIAYGDGELGITRRGCP